MSRIRIKQLVKKKLKDIYRSIMKILFSYGKININGEGIINLIDVGAIGNLPSPWFENSKKIKKFTCV